MDYLLLLLGFAALIKSSDFLVDGASSLARRYGMSDYVVGLTVVAFATSLPELVVNMIAVIDGNAGMALGNVLGSNTLNIFVVVGITAAISPLAVSGKKIIREITLTILLSALLLKISFPVRTARCFWCCSRFSCISRSGLPGTRTVLKKRILPLVRLCP